MDAIMTAADPSRFVKRGEGPDPVDIHVGQRVRQARVLKGLSQEKLGEACGITFQQLQKYERGMNRVSASMLHRLVQALDVPHSFFFDGLEGAASEFDASGLTLGRKHLELIRYFDSLPADSKERVYLLTKALAGADSAESAA